MFRKLVDLFRRQKASAAEPVEKPSSINAYGSHKETDVARLWVPIPRGRPVQNQPPPDKPGLYRVIKKKTRKLIYIGAAKNLRVRKAVHKRSGKFDPNQHHFLFQLAKDGVSAKALYEHEAKKIKKHRPPLNRNNGGGGRLWTASIPAPAPNPVSETAPPVGVEHIAIRRGMKTRGTH